MNTNQAANTFGKLESNKMHLLHDIYSLNLIAPLINEYPFLPFTSASLRPYCLNHILNDIVINSRTKIIEFGCGISTIMIGRLIKRNGLHTSVVSIDSNKEWIEVVKKNLKREGITNITLVHAPLIRCPLALSGNEWYDLQKIKAATVRRKYDLVIIDGPPAWEEFKQLV